MEELIDSSGTLFSDTTVVVHISGNKENSGRILKTNQGLTKVFGYNKTEVMGHQINILMPSLYARRHNEFVEKYFDTGHATVFNTERTFYGLHRNGFCFCIKLFVKHMPSLDEGIQYVGMMKQQQSEFEFILTSPKGVIDSFTSGVTSLLNLPATLFKEVDINIQILAPDLIKVFGAGDNKKKTLLDKYKEPGGQKLTFITPKHFADHANTGKKKSSYNALKGIHSRGNVADYSKKGKTLTYREINKILNKKDAHMERQISPQDLLSTYEYNDYDSKQVVKCEIFDLAYGNEYKDIESLRVRVFKIPKATPKQLASGVEQGSEYMDELAEPDFSIPSIKDAEEAGRQSEKADLYKLVVNSDEELVRPSGKEESKERPETQTTEKLPNNVVTTEGRQETLGEKYKSKGEDMKVVSEESSEHADKEQKSIKNSEPKEDLDEGTPRVNLGDIKGPQFTNRDAPIIDEHDAEGQDDAHGSEHPHSTGRGGKEDQKARKHAHSRSSKALPELHFRGNREGKPGTVINDETHNTLQARIQGLKQKTSQKDEEMPPEIIGIDVTDENVIKANSPIRRLRSTGGQNADEAHPGSLLNRPDSARGQLKLAETKSAGDHFATVQKEAGRDTLGKSKERKSSTKLPADSTINRMGRMQRSNKLRIADDDYDPERAAQQEYQLTEEELKLRKSIYDSIAKKNKDKKKEEVKKETAKKPKDDSEDEKEEKENSEEHSEEEKSEKEQEITALEELETEQDTTSSVASASKSSATRSYYSLRAAIDEKFIPPSMRKMTYIAQLVFLLILGLAITYFALTIVRYNKTKNNIKGLANSQLRINSLTNVGLHVTNMMIISADYVQHQEDPELDQTDSFIYDSLEVTQENFTQMAVKLKAEADLLKSSQTELSMRADDFSSKTLEVVNPADVSMQYMPVPQMESTMIYTMWQTLIEIVVCSYRIANMEIGTIDGDAEATTYVVDKNLLNSIIVKLDPAADALEENIKSRMNQSSMLFMILLIVASVALFLSTILLIPVVNKIKKNKQDVFELFMHVKKHQANNELRRCKKFIIENQTGQETEMIAVEGEEDVEDIDTTNDQLKKLQNITSYGTSRRKFKRLVLNLGLVMFKFVFLILIIEGYFILSYFLARSFLDHAKSLTMELNRLMSRKPTNSLLLVMQKYPLPSQCNRAIIFKNYNLTLKNRDAAEYMEEFQGKLYEDEEKLLDVSSVNNE